MKKIVVLLMAVILSSLLVLSTSASYQACTAYKTSTPPTLDGVIADGEWGTPICALNSYEEILPYSFSWIPQDWPEFMDQYGDVLADRSLMPSAIKIYMTWDDEFFYLGLKINVETRCAPNYTGLWQKDCVFTNFCDDPYIWDVTAYYGCTFTVHDDGDFIAEYGENGGYGVNPTTTDGDWAGVRDEVNKTTTYELKFYWDELLGKAVTKQMVAGDAFGINICIAPANFDGDPTNIIDIVPAGLEANPDYGDNQYNWAVTLADGEAPAAETEAPAAETEAPAETPVATPSAWAVEEVNAAIAAGLVPEELQNGYTNGITRADLSKMLGILIDKAYGKEAEKTDAAFSDTTDAAVLKAANLGIINGYAQDDGTFMFKPENTLKRSEMSAIINRVAKLCGEETTGFDAEVKFEDTAAHWCNSELGYPVHMGIVKGTSETTFSPENTLTVEQTIMMIYRTFTALNK